MCDVLVVDDDFMVAKAHERVVELSPGFRVIGVAHSGSEALALIDSNRPQLVLLDMYLPDMSGLEVIRRCREKGIDVDFLVLSAARETEMVSGALQGGIVSYLLKPFKIADLQSRLSAYAERRRLLTRSEGLNQEDLDHAFGAISAVSATLPKGLSAETAELVEGVLKESRPDVAASECAEAVGISRVVARKYLEHFVNTGTAGVVLRYGRAGRPQRRYSWIAPRP